MPHNVAPLVLERPLHIKLHAISAIAQILQEKENRATQEAISHSPLSPNDENSFLGKQKEEQISPPEEEYEIVGDYELVENPEAIKEEQKNSVLGTISGYLWPKPKKMPATKEEEFTLIDNDPYEEDQVKKSTSLRKSGILGSSK